MVGLRYAHKALLGAALLFALCRVGLAEGPCPRLVSLAPSTTEVAFALGLDDQIAAVSRYAKYPAAVQAKPRIGSLFDVSLESLVRLRAKPVLLLKEHHTLFSKLQTLSIPYLELDHQSIDGIIKSVETLGVYCEVPDWRALQKKLRKERNRWKQTFANTKPARALVIIGEASGSGQQQSLYLSGNDGYYSEALSIVNATNAYEGKTSMMPTLSVEGLKVLNPDVIIQIAPGLTNAATDFSAFAKLFPGVPAIKNKQVFTFTEDYMFTPGPRFPALLARLGAAIHPEVSLK